MLYYCQISRVGLSVQHLHLWYKWVLPIRSIDCKMRRWEVYPLSCIYFLIVVKRKSYILKLCANSLLTIHLLIVIMNYFRLYLHSWPVKYSFLLYWRWFYLNIVVKHYRFSHFDWYMDWIYRYYFLCRNIMPKMDLRLTVLWQFLPHELDFLLNLIFYLLIWLLFFNYGLE